MSGTDSSARDTLSRTAARLLTVGFSGTRLTSELKELLDAGVAGVVLFRRNVEHAQQVAELTASIKRFAGRPLFVAVDQEGGAVQRLREGFTRVPPMRMVGDRANVELAHRLGRVVGRELRAVGIDVNFAPVLDVDTNPDNPVIGDRSFGRHAQMVAALGVALGRGLEEEGVASCGKHFPGHGDTHQDSHLQLPRLSHDLTRLRAVELVPFRAWSEAGLAAIMTAHVLFDSLDDALPATMSRRILDELLRRELGYSGLVFSDDLEMRAIADHYGCERAAVRGALAGVDNFLCCHSSDVAHGIIRCLVRAVETGELDTEHLEVTADRVDTFARRWAAPPQSARLEQLQSAEARAVLEELGAQADAPPRSPGDDPTEIMDAMRAAARRV